MPHYIVDRPIFRVSDHVMLDPGAEIGAVTAPNIAAARRRAAGRYPVKTGEGLARFEKLALYAVRGAAALEWVEQKQEADLRALAEFTELMQTIDGLGPRHNRTTETAEGKEP